MHANPSLSPEQQHALELCYVTVLAASTFLESIEHQLEPTDRIGAQNCRDLCTMSEQRLLEAFPEINEWLSRRSEDDA